MTKPKTVSEYIAAAPKEKQKILRDMRSILKKAAPKANEVVKWGVPMFEESRILFAYAAFKKSLNFMPTPSAMKPFKTALAKYKTGKGSISFPYTEPLPKALITKIAKLRVKELREKDVRWM